MFSASRIDRPAAGVSGRGLGVLLILAIAPACSPPEPVPAAVDRPEILDRITRQPETGQVHLIRLVQNADTYAFDPDSLTIRAGDVVRFVASGSQPESVAFELDGPQPVRSYVESQSLQRGVLLTTPGDAYDVPFQGAPPGRYRYFSVPHIDRGMRGSIEVVE